LRALDVDSIRFDQLINLVLAAASGWTTALDER